MKIIKYSLFTILILVGLFGLRLVYTTYINPKSPKGQANYVQGALALSVHYSRPSKRGRLIFGTKKDSALVPYGQYWRLGANKATTLNTNQTVVIGSEKVLAGKYRLYAVPYATHWEVVFHNKPEGSGAAVPDPAGDLFRLQANTQVLEQEVDQFTVDFVPKDSLVFLRFNWDKTSVQLPIHFK